MKKFFPLVFLIITLFLNAQVRQNLKIDPNGKVGLTLAGGGAKGLAHVGVLKVLDSLNVKVDYISGTSMGSIVGGLYAAGYSGKEIERIVLSTDFYNLILNEKQRSEGTLFNKTNNKYLLNFPVSHGQINLLPKAISTGQKNIYMLKELFRGVSNITDFSKLPIPFLCVATNLETGKKKILEQGDLVQSIMASSAYPGLMDPVKIGDSIYIDGAMSMNYPAQPLKEDKKMDIIVGVDLQQALSKRESLTSAVTITNQTVDYGIQTNVEQQYKFVDLNIKPDLTGYSATSYGDKDSIVAQGYHEALKYVDVLNRLPKRSSAEIRSPLNDVFSTVYKIDSLEVQNNKIFNADYIRGKMNLKLPSVQTYGSINKMVEKLYATDNYTLISYDIVQRDGRNILQMKVTEDDTRFFVKFGLHYDDVFKTGLLINATAKRLLFRNSILSLDVIVGDQPRYYFNYLIDNGYIPGFGLYSSGMNLELRDLDNNVRGNLNWLRNEVFIQSTFRDKYALGGGISHDYFEVREGSTSNRLANNNFFNPYVYLKSDTRDERDFATKGFFLDAQGKLLDVFNNYSDDKQFILKADVKAYFPVGSRFTIGAEAFGGFLFGNDVNPYYQYRAGAIFQQPLNNFVPFYGSRFGSIDSRNIIALTPLLQFKVYKNIFAAAHFSTLTIFDDVRLRDILNFNYSSVGVSAGYRSPVGPIKFDYSKSLQHSKGVFSVILGHWF